MQHSVTQLLSNNPEFDEDRLKRYFTKLVAKLRMLEEYKYLPPKYSCAFDTLLDFYGVDLKELTSQSSNQRLIKTSYNKRTKRKGNNSNSSSSGSSMTGSMLGYYKRTSKKKSRVNRTQHSSDSSVSSTSKYKRAVSRENRTTRKITKSGHGIRIKQHKRGKVYCLNIKPRDRNQGLIKVAVFQV